MDLKTFYDDLKSEKDRLDGGITPVVHTTPISTQLGTSEWKRKAGDCAKQLSDNCARHMILDIYCKILPLDDDFICGHKGMMKSDIDSMLVNKGMTPTQYLQSCANNTKSPMCEYVLNMCNLIGKQFYEDASDKLKDAKEKGLDIPSPSVPDEEMDDEITSQLIDIKDDPSYTSFIDELKQRTEKQLIGDISNIIINKKNEKDMSFNPKNPVEESTVSMAINGIQNKLMAENVDSSPIMDDIMGLAIRESTLNIMNECFKMKGSDRSSFKSNMRYCKGHVITESAITSLIEEAKSSEEVENVISDANKKKNEEIDSKLKASDVVNAGDNEKPDKKEDK